MKKFYLMTAVLTAFVVVLAGCTGGIDSVIDHAEKEAMGYQRISMDEAVKMMEKEDNELIMDVRTESEFKSGHIEGAVNIPVETIDEEVLKKLPDTGRLIMVYCRSGNRSKTASAKLVELGYTNVVEFGGIKDWPGEVVTD